MQKIGNTISSNSSTHALLEKQKSKKITVFQYSYHKNCIRFYLQGPTGTYTVQLHVWGELFKKIREQIFLSP